MLFSITHRTKLDYSQPVTESVMEVRARPRTDEHQVLRQFGITIQPSARATHHEDWLGNTVHQFSVLKAHDQVLIDSQSVVETREHRGSLSALTQRVGELVFDHHFWDYLQDHGPVSDAPALPVLASKLGLERSSTVGAAIETVLLRTRDVISYRRGVTNSGSTVRDVLRLKAGVCQDFAHLALALLRRANIPCRYVSGYLYRADAIELETHAWIECFTEQFGWLGVDPTHGILTDEHYVALAVGRSYADVPPNRGVYRGEATERISVSVEIEALDAMTRPAQSSPPTVRPNGSSERRLLDGPYTWKRGLDQQRLAPSAAGVVVQQQRQQQQ